MQNSAPNLPIRNLVSLLVVNVLQFVCRVFFFKEITWVLNGDGSSAGHH